MKLLLLTNPQLAPALLRIAGQWPERPPIEVVDTLPDLERSVRERDAALLLVSFGTGVIVPRHLMDAVDACVNIHPGSPEYPGRDPHHFAACDLPGTYGATAHYLAKRVDSGPIIDVELFSIDGAVTPRELLDRAEASGLKIFARLVPRLLRGERPQPLDLKWGPRKTRRSDFTQLCRVSPLDDGAEFERRRRAAEMPPYRNLWTELHGHRFVIAESAADFESRFPRWEEFTESAYADLLKLAAAHYRFATFTERDAVPHVIWRHDVDYSVHRALRLATIEHERGVVATYFFCLRLPFYNMFEPAVQEKARSIAALGHRVGLHFDASGYPGEVWSGESLESRLLWEKECLEKIVGTKVEAVSFHDPGAGDMLRFDQDVLGGMVNAYGAGLRREYAYCSDSNGHWRFKPIPDVLRAHEHDRLQVLTHPGWWTERALPPRMRIEQAVMGRARAVMREYDAHLERSNRANIR